MMQVEESGFLNLLLHHDPRFFSAVLCGAVWRPKHVALDGCPLSIRVCRTFILEILMGCRNVLIPPETDDYTYKEFAVEMPKGLILTC